jgi:hypothetical protein
MSRSEKYLPPYDQFTVAFARDVLEGKRTLLSNAEVRRIVWPNYAEISVKALWPEFSVREETAQYFPSYIPQGRQMDKTFFFNVLNTIVPEELEQILRYALVQRNDKATDPETKDVIMVTPEIEEELRKFPFVSVSTAFHLTPHCRQRRARCSTS